MLVYLDTNIWVYAHEGHNAFGSPARDVMRSLKSGNHRLASSLFVLGELLVLPTRLEKEFVTAIYKRLFASDELRLLPYTAAAVPIYSHLRSSLRLKPLDALHLATAASANVDAFVTEDKDLLRISVAGIGRICNLESF